jgi:hypothetical protein
VKEQLAKIVQALLLANPYGNNRCSAGGGGSYDGRDERGSSGDAEDVDSHISSISHTMHAAHCDTFGGLALNVRPPSYAGEAAVSSHGTHDAITGAGAKADMCDSLTSSSGYHLNIGSAPDGLESARCSSVLSHAVSLDINITHAAAL